MEYSPLEPAIVTPVKSKHTPRIGPLSVMVATQPDIKMLQETALFSSGMSQPLFAGRLYIGSGAGERLSMAGPFIGAPYAVMVLETLIAWGARRILFWGWCGAVSSAVRIGDIVVPTGAIIDEGSSRHYRADGEEIAQPSPAMMTAVRRALTATRASWHEGLIWTTDGVFRETKGKVLHFRTRGALAVEMEMSALFTAAAYHGVELGGILVVSDDLSTLAWRPGFKSEPFRNGRRAAGDVVQTLCKERFR